MAEAGNKPSETNVVQIMKAVSGRAKDRSYQSVETVSFWEDGQHG